MDELPGVLGAAWPLMFRSAGVSAAHPLQARGLSTLGAVLVNQVKPRYSSRCATEVGGRSIRIFKLLVKNRQKYSTKIR